MNIEETKKAIEVMQAYVDGKEIECRSSSCQDLEWKTIKNPKWCFHFADYRVKQEPKVRPFTNEELRGLVGKAVIDDKTTRLVVSCDDGFVNVFCCGLRSAISLMQNFTFIDGSPCGVEETE